MTTHYRRSTFSKTVMVSVGISALEARRTATYLHFVDPDVKINGKYYRDVLLLLDPAALRLFHFSTRWSLAHLAKETVQLLKTATILYEVNFYDVRCDAVMTSSSHYLSIL